ncbi:MAG: efflux RND transporter periplasmic adaptor subunit [Algisphaera sp.]
MQPDDTPCDESCALDATDATDATAAVVQEQTDVSEPSKALPVRPQKGLFWRRLGLGLLLLGGAVLFAAVLIKSRPKVQSKLAEDVRPVVRTFAAQQSEVRRQWAGQGTAQALRSADVPARVMATVVERVDGVRPGTAVTEGQVLVRLDAEDFLREAEAARQRIAEIDASLAQLQVEWDRLNERLALEDSDVAMARTEFNRQVRLNEREVTTGKDVDIARRTLITAQRSQLTTRQTADLIAPRRRKWEAQKAGQEAKVNLAELARQRTEIVSPLTGVVQALDVEVGENVSVGQRVARVVAVDRVEVPVALPAAAGLTVAVGDRLTLRVSGHRALGAFRPTWLTVVARVAPEYDQETRTLTVYAELASGGAELAARGAESDTSRRMLPPPGMFLEATVEVSQSALRWVVPRRAVREGRIQVVQAGTLASRGVEVDFYISGLRPELSPDDDQWAVLRGDALTPGVQVLIDAANRLPDGTAVEMRDVAAGPSPVGPPASPAASGVDVVDIEADLDTSLDKEDAHDDAGGAR